MSTQRNFSALFVGISLALMVTLTVPHNVRANPGVLYAAPTVRGSADCSSWGNACTLQQALSTAVNGDEIWVEAGIHLPTTNSTDRTATVQLKTGVAVYGGFAGIETSRDERNWKTNITILSGDIDQNDINNDGNYIAKTSADIQGANAYHVVTGSGTNNTAILNGFVITAGQAYSPAYYGGGLFNQSGSPKLTNLIFSGNTATHGGGMFNGNSSNPTLTNVTFSGNTTDHGGPYVYFGGGMYNLHSNPTLMNATFIGNTASGYGGGMSNEYSSPTLINVTFSGNTATWSGGGIDNEYEGSTPTLTNVILWGNSASSHPEIYNMRSTPSISYSDIQDCGGSDSWNSACGINNGGNIDADPLFVNAAGNDLHLQVTSLAIDAGNNDAVPAGVTADLDGNSRFVDIASVPDTGNGTPPIVDMGAFEALNKIYLPLPALAINYSTGAPGSYFTITGSNFPPSSTATITVNGNVLGTVPTDTSGGFIFLLETSLTTDEGFYRVTASVNPSAMTQFTLDAEDDVRPQEESETVFVVPDGIAYHVVYLPLIVK